VATMLACMPDVFLVAGWAPDQLTATPATLDAVIVEARHGCEAVARRAADAHVLAIAATPPAAHEALAAGATAVLELPADAAMLRGALLRLRAHVLTSEGSNGNGIPESDAPIFGARLKDRAADIDPASVRWLEAFQKLIRWHTTDGAIDRRGSLETLVKELPPELFLRAHRSAIINREYVRFVRDSVDGTLIVVLDDGTRVHVSRTYAPTIRRAFPL
jgi:two-component system LytT family response regulator